MRKISKLEDEILDLIDNRDEFTRSDLKGCVSAIVLKIIMKADELKAELKEIKS